MQIAGRSVEDDVSAAEWIVTALRGQEWATVSSIVPPVFDAYVRVFHPAVRHSDDVEDFLAGLPPDAPLPPDEDVTWAEVAAFNGRTAHPAMEWVSVTGSWEFRGNDDQPGMWNESPPEGHLPVSVATRLADVLAGYTTTPANCWFGIESSCHEGTGRTLHLPAREFWLVRGPVGLAAVNFADEPVEQSANLWWPDDRSWYVATDIDLMTTYVGGSVACITGILAAYGLEAAPVPAHQRITWDADTVNPPPMDGPG
ncbi:MAG TPA: hypothetical protein VGD09_09155 [Blastococcus sp.]